MIYDLCLGILAYVGTSLFFGEPFQVDYFLLALIFSFLPDIDFIPYVLLRKKLDLVTHWFIHFPLIFVFIGGVLLLFSPYVGVLFLLCTLGHLVHDLFSETIDSYPQGLKLLYPFSKKSLSWQNHQFVFLNEAEQRTQLERRRKDWQHIEKRSLWWEVIVRMETISPATWILLLLCTSTLIWFIIHS